MKRSIAILLMLACTACAPVTTKVNVPDIAKSDALPVSDMRPASEKENKIFSLLITSKEYGIIRAGDARLSPPPIRLLQHETFQKFSIADHLPQMTVYHFVIYQNMKSQLRSGAVGAGFGGMVGAMVGNAIGGHDTSSQTRDVNEKTFDSVSDEYQRGLYTSAENPDKASVYIVYVDTDIDGKRVFTRTIASMEKHGDRNPLTDAVQLAIRNHLGHYDTNVPVMAATASVVTAATTFKSVPDPVANVSTASPASPDIQPASASAPIASMPSQTSAAGAAVESMAQNVASQMGCGTVQGNGDSTFTAPCGTYGILINCDGDQCRPMHTVHIKSNE